MRIVLIFVLIIIIGITSNTALAGWVISEVSYDKFGNRQFQTTFIQNNLIRYETESSVAIINLNSGEITLLFGMYKLYWQGSIEEFKKGTLEVFEKKLLKMIETAEPDQREVAIDLIAEMRKGLVAKEMDTISDNLNLTIIRTDIIENIAGFNAFKYNIAIEDSVVESIWITDSINPYIDIDIESMISFTNELKPNKDRNDIDGSSEYLKLINKGLAVKSQERNPHGGYYTTEITHIIETQINDEIFQYPPNYRKALLTEIMLIKESNIDQYNLKQNFQRAKDNPLYD